VANASLRVFDYFATSCHVAGRARGIAHDSRSEDSSFDGRSNRSQCGVFFLCLSGMPVVAHAQIPSYAPAPDGIDLAVQNIPREVPVWCCAAVAQQLVFFAPYTQVTYG